MACSQLYSNLSKCLDLGALSTLHTQFNTGDDGQEGATTPAWKMENECRGKCFLSKSSRKIQPSWQQRCQRQAKCRNEFSDSELCFPLPHSVFLLPFFVYFMPWGGILITCNFVAAKRARKKRQQRFEKYCFAGGGMPYTKKGRSFNRAF